MKRVTTSTSGTALALLLLIVLAGLRSPTASINPYQMQFGTLLGLPTSADDSSRSNAGITKDPFMLRISIRLMVILSAACRTCKTVSGYIRQNPTETIRRIGGLAFTIYAIVRAIQGA